MIRDFECSMFDDFTAGGSGFCSSEIDNGGTSGNTPFLYKYDVLTSKYTVSSEDMDGCDKIFKNPQLSPSFIKELTDRIYSMPIDDFPVVDQDDDVIVGLVSDKMIPFEVKGNEIILHMDGQDVKAPDFVMEAVLPEIPKLRRENNHEMEYI